MLDDHLDESFMKKYLDEMHPLTDRWMKESEIVKEETSPSKPTIK